MAKLDLRPNEQVLFPNPLIEEEKNPLIVTTTRVIYTGDGKKQELDALKITYTNKGNNPKLMPVIVALFVLGLPFVGFGAYKYYVYRNLPTEAPAEAKDAPSKAYSKLQQEQFKSNKRNLILGVVLGGFGVALGGGAYLLYKRRFIVAIGGAGKVLHVPVKDEIDQDKILSMIGAAQTAARSMAAVQLPTKVNKTGAAPPATAPPAAKK